MKGFPYQSGIQGGSSIIFFLELDFVKRERIFASLLPPYKAVSF